VIQSRCAVGRVPARGAAICGVLILRGNGSTVAKTTALAKHAAMLGR
jgi:hypothetical protein